MTSILLSDYAVAIVTTALVFCVFYVFVLCKCVTDLFARVEKLEEKLRD